MIGKYEVSDKKQESLHGVTNLCNNCNIKDTSLDPDIWFNELYNLSLRFKNIKAKYEKDEDEMKAHVFYVLTEEYKQLRVSWSVKFSKIQFIDLKK